MPRTNGSYIGIDANPTSSQASGIWSVRDAERLLRSDKWPSQPGVPGAPSAAPGDGQVSLSWGALATSPSITDYGIQYSSNSGTTWTTFSDGVGAATSATVTGLTNGTSYIFRLYGINALGDGPFGSASGAVAPAALDTLLLLRMNGSNGSTTFTDSSAYGRSVTANGDAAISTAQSKFGGASGLFDGSGDYLLTAVSMDWDEDFTLEFWLRRVGAGSGQVNTVCAVGEIQSGVGGMHLALSTSGVVYLDNATTGGIQGGSAPLDQWVHIAVVRQGGTNILYVDGANVGTSEQTFDVTNSVVEIGGTPRYGFYTNGYIDEFRIVAGTAIYTGDFTPPTAPF